jgi:hypothetical protein
MPTSQKAFFRVTRQYIWIEWPEAETEGAEQKALWDWMDLFQFSDIPAQALPTTTYKWEQVVVGDQTQFWFLPKTTDWVVPSYEPELQYREQCLLLPHKTYCEVFELGHGETERDIQELREGFEDEEFGERLLECTPAATIFGNWKRYHRSLFIPGRGWSSSNIREVLR